MNSGRLRETFKTVSVDAHQNTATTSIVSMRTIPNLLGADYHNLLSDFAVNPPLWLETGVAMLKKNL
jgi:hypothetical protein